jgi:hypothetical protein
MDYYWFFMFFFTVLVLFPLLNAEIDIYLQLLVLKIFV